VDVKFESERAYYTAGSAHDPETFPSWENPLMSARATARFDGGRAMVLLIHANMTT